jgi:hypothetical protein
MACIGRLERHALVSVSLVTEDIKFFIQESTRFSTLEERGVHSNAESAPSLIGGPRYVKEMVPSLRFNILAGEPT